MITLSENSSFDPVISPQPSEGVKATGVDGSSYIINGATATGDVRYVKMTDGVRIRHLGGTSTALAVSVAGLDVTVQLATNALSAVTSTANDVVNLINATPTVLLLINAFVGTAPGTGIAGIWTTFMDLSGDVRGSIRPGLQSLTNRDRFIADYLVRQPIYNQFRALKQNSLNSVSTKTTLNYLGYTDTLGKNIAFCTAPILSDIPPSTYLEGGGSFAALTTYYLYADSIGAYQYSTIAPDDALIFKTGDLRKKYLMVIHTGTDASVVEFFRDGSRMHLMRTIGSVAGVAVYASTIPSAPAEATVNLGAYLPKTAKAVELLLNFDNNTLATAYRYVFVRADGTGTGLKYTIDLPPWPAAQAGGVSSGMLSEKIVIPIDNSTSSAKVYLSSSTSASLVTATARIVGWIV